MSPPPIPQAFTPIFDRAIAACARAQMLSERATEAVAHARSARPSSPQLRGLVGETRDVWAGADIVYGTMRREVERVAHALRDSGVDDDTAAATVRAHIRFVLYDGGLPERVAEPVVSRASTWVHMVYAAA